MIGYLSLSLLLWTVFSSVLLFKMMTNSIRTTLQRNHFDVFGSILNENLCEAEIQFSSGLSRAKWSMIMAKVVSTNAHKSIDSFEVPICSH